MEYRTFKSLDKPSVLFGIRGGFIWYAAAGAGVGALLGFILADVLGTLWFFVSFILFAGGSIGGTFVLQSRFSERQIKRLAASRQMPEHLHVSPYKIYFSEDAGERVKKES